MATGTLRLVRVFENWKKEAEKCRGFFHQFGTDYEEFDQGGVPFTVAIVELADGTIIMPRADLIQFIVEDAPKEESDA
jgi:hypothetical protein